MRPGGAGLGLSQSCSNPASLFLANVLTTVYVFPSRCRWRFTRKWQAEQMKQFEPPAPPGANGGLAEGEDEEEWTAALRLMDTVDGGLNMQIGRTLSLHNSSMVGGSGMSVDQSLDQSLNLMSPGLSQCVLLDGSIKEVSPATAAWVCGTGPASLHPPTHTLSCGTR